MNIHENVRIEKKHENKVDQSKDDDSEKYTIDRYKKKVRICYQDMEVWINIDKLTLLEIKNQDIPQSHWGEKAETNKEYKYFADHKESL